MFIINLCQTCVTGAKNGNYVNSLRELVISSLFEEDLRVRLGWEAYRRHHLFHELYRQNFISFKI